MDSFELIVFHLFELLVLVLAVLLFHKFHTNRTLLPPGPIAWPLIGNVLQIGKRPSYRFLQWSIKYGSLFRIKLGPLTGIVVTDAALLRQIFANTASTGRIADNPVFLEITKGPYGLASSLGATWVEQRRFAVQTLRSFGYGTAQMEAAIQQEASAITKYLSYRSGQLISANGLFNAPVVNTIWNIVAGERFHWEDGQCCNVIQAFDNLMEAIDTCFKTGLTFAPFLRYFAPKALGWDNLVKTNDVIRRYVEDKIRQRMLEFDQQHLRDFLDHQINEMQNAKDPQSSFYGETGFMNTAAAFIELFLAGSETTSSTLMWALLYLSTYPEIQLKLHLEISTVLGKRQPTLSDRNRLPYVDATMQEIHRIRPAIPLGFPHKMLADLDFNGFVFKKDMIIFSNIYGIQNDPRIWLDPETFKPERFINLDGSCEQNHPNLVTFSVGNRKCLGETLGKDTVFLFLVNILQKFEVFHENSIITPNYEPQEGLSSKPPNFKVIFKPREK